MDDVIGLRVQRTNVKSVFADKVDAAVTNADNFQTSVFTVQVKVKSVVAAVNKGIAGSRSAIRRGERWKLRRLRRPFC